MIYFEIKSVTYFINFGSAAGVLLLVFTPVVTARARFIDVPSDSDFVFSINAYIFGNGEARLKGTVNGIPEDDVDPVDKNQWDTYLGVTEPYPDIAIYLSFIGLGLAILGSFLSIFGGNSGLRIIGALLGIIGGGLGIAGCFLLYNFNTEFQENATTVLAFVESLSGTTQSNTWTTFGLGWLFAVCSSGLIALGSILLLIVKPKKY